jgi:hypothetical protein
MFRGTRSKRPSTCPLPLLIWQVSEVNQAAHSGTKLIQLAPPTVENRRGFIQKIPCTHPAVTLTPLIVSIRAGNSAAAEYLIRRGANVNQPAGMQDGIT